ncbi:SMI1/KNR4 family protein [Actinomadura welshii]
MKLVEFERLVGLARYAPTSVDWEALERRIGLRLPQDYRRIFQMYPDLQIGKFLGIFSPPSNVDDYVRQNNEVMEPLRDLAQDEITLLDGTEEGRLITPYPFYPERSGLLPWGATENGEVCLWLTDKENSNEWPIIVTDGLGYWRYDGNILSFVGDLLSGNVTCPIFPDDFPENDRIDQFEVDADRESSR